MAGKAKQNVSGYRDLGGFNLYSTGNFNQSNSNVVITELEGKLGINYNYLFSCGNVKIDLGYLWMNYIGAISSYTGIGILGSSLGIPNSSNFNLNGVYLGLNLNY